MRNIRLTFSTHIMPGIMKKSNFENIDPDPISSNSGSFLKPKNALQYC